MCAIAGIFGRADDKLVGRMLDTMRHRGPDDLFVLGGNNFSLGACRLSIMDVEDGRQPVVNEAGTVFAAQNGEIYNYPALKEMLLKKGHALTTGCDTEVLPHLFEEAGLDLPKQLDGMFAVAVWDNDQQRGFLARDRMGKKPLYYTVREKCLYFGSEIKALLEIPGFEKQLHPASLHHYLSLKHVPHPGSIFQGIQQVPPGHYLVYRPGHPVDLVSYWTPVFSVRDAEVLEEEALVDQFLNLLKKAVKKRLAADVPIGFFLSGGIDSSLTTALAAEMTGGDIKTFTLTYESGSGTPGKDADKYWADFVAKKYKTDHREETVHYANFPNRLRSILRHFDEPFSGVIATYFLSELMHRHVTVAISGDGADELFGSYLSHRIALPLANYPEYLKTREAALIPGFEKNPEILEKLYSRDDWAWRSRLLVYSEEEKQALYAEDFRRRLGSTSTVDYLRQGFADLNGKDPLNRILEWEFKTQLPDQILTFVDRLSMAHSLEVRCPFLDTDVVEFVTALPGSWKIHQDTTKYLLKQAARRYFPAEMVERKKEGFLMPISQWLSGDLEPYVRETLSLHRIALLEVFDPEAVQKLVDQLYATPNPPYQQVNQVYALVVYVEWAQLYLSRK